MSHSLFWLTLTIGATTLMWLPYILNTIAIRGLWRAMANPNPEDTPLAPWAERAKKAHANAVENLVLFAGLVLIAWIAEKESPALATTTMIYFFARATHFLVYTFGVPVLRTLSFFVGFGCQIWVLLQLL